MRNSHFADGESSPNLTLEYAYTYLLELFCLDPNIGLSFMEELVIFSRLATAAEQLSPCRNAE